jgi:hypothetical protein
MAILNQEIMIPHPLKYLLIAHGYMNPFHIEWLSYHAIFYFSFAREILKYALSLGHTPDFFLLSYPLYASLLKHSNTTREVQTHLILDGTL